VSHTGLDTTFLRARAACFPRFRRPVVGTKAVIQNSRTVGGKQQATFAGYFDRLDSFIEAIRHLSDAHYPPYINRLPFIVLKLFGGVRPRIATRVLTQWLNPVVVTTQEQRVLSGAPPRVTTRVLTQWLNPVVVTTQEQRVRVRRRPRITARG